MFPSSNPPIQACPGGVEVPASTTTIERLETIAQIDRVAWDRLAPDDVFGSYGWLRTVEETSLSRRPLYIVAREAGALVAAAPCYYPGRAGEGMDRIVFGRFGGLARVLRIGVSPALVCGTPTGLSEHVRVEPSATPQQRQQWTMLLVDAMEQFAREHRITLCFRNVVDHVSPLVQTLKDRGYLHASEMPTTAMDVRWASFEEYCRDLKRDHPWTARQIRREIKRAREAGIVFRKLDDAIPDVPRLHEILDAHNRRLNGAPFPFQPSFLDALKRHMGANAFVYVSLNGDGPIGVSLAIRAGETTFLPMIGIDYTLAPRTLVYFNNAYNVPIEDAIATGVRRIYCGKLVYDVKLRRGFRLVDLSAYMYVPAQWRGAMLRPVFAVQRMRIQRMLGRMQAAGPRGAVP